MKFTDQGNINEFHYHLPKQPGKWISVIWASAVFLGSTWCLAVTQEMLGSSYVVGQYQLLESVPQANTEPGYIELNWHDIVFMLLSSHHFVQHSVLTVAFSVQG